uniref:HIT-type domain-containing protein n=1 Tax=Caenorhabditis tropicalis TaxID=1561998 RepID=A0A1I7UCI7_9PELO
MARRFGHSQQSVVSSKNEEKPKSERVGQSVHNTMLCPCCNELPGLDCSSLCYRNERFHVMSILKEKSNQNSFCATRASESESLTK